ncbi:MAG: patatin-like phospholipase family protein [Myxococcota bacterium]
MSETVHRVGVVLSGGGVRAAAHVGLLKALSERDLEPTALAGASAGALVAAMYATRRSFNQTLDVFRDNELFSWNYFGMVRKPGLLDAEKIMEGFEHVLGDKTFSDTTRELHIVATNLLDGTAHYFRDGPLAPAVMASSAYPGVISPIEFDGMLLSDGGIVDNLPIEPLLGRCDVLIGSFVNPVETLTMDELRTTLAVSQRAFHISTTNILRAKLAQCDFAIAPVSLLDIGIFELKRTNEAFEIGYETAQSILDGVEQRLERARALRS